MLKNISNLAPWDRILRVAVGLGMLYLGWSDYVDGLGAIALVVFAWVPLLTGALGWCPVYSILGISSNKAATSGKVR
jgi:hypothetical protein